MKNFSIIAKTADEYDRARQRRLGCRTLSSAACKRHADGLNNQALFYRP
jgi:hypothetical protein